MSSLFGESDTRRVPIRGRWRSRVNPLFSLKDAAMRGNRK
jgi:hypothetical protein